MNLFPPAFYERTNVTQIVQELLGACLISEIGGIRTSGLIVETEAYAGVSDKACHAHFKRRSKKCAPMYLRGGHAYVYLCYGIHHLFNIVTSVENEPEAVLVRAILPLEGSHAMQNRRQKTSVDLSLTNGPGKVCQALNIDLQKNGVILEPPDLYIAKGLQFHKDHIEITPRIGIDYAEEDALLPYRFVIKKGMQKELLTQIKSHQKDSSDIFGTQVNRWHAKLQKNLREKMPKIQ